MKYPYEWFLCLPTDSRMKSKAKEFCSCRLFRWDEKILKLFNILILCLHSLSCSFLSSRRSDYMHILYSNVRFLTKIVFRNFQKKCWTLTKMQLFIYLNQQQIFFLLPIDSRWDWMNIITCNQLLMYTFLFCFFLIDEIDVTHEWSCFIENGVLPVYSF
jgi:hypothetical protein